MIYVEMFPFMQCLPFNYDAALHLMILRQKWWMSTQFQSFPQQKKQQKTWLVVSAPLKNISQIGIISPSRGENKKSLKPPPSNKKTRYLFLWRENRPQLPCTASPSEKTTQDLRMDGSPLKKIWHKTSGFTKHEFEVALILGMIFWRHFQTKTR